jgi:hypothetical protein
VARIVQAYEAFDAQQADALAAKKSHKESAQ